MTTTATLTTPAVREGTRREIQALRALAVLLVVGFHLWPGRLPGGFVGVDAFFVVSGFLITGHLMRELQSEGRIHFGQFWARRARRLLPASYLVLAVSAVAVWLLLPEAFWQQSFKEILASSVYVQNWRLAADAVDYLGADNGATVVQHFWTLSVEEQFYLVWPVLIAVAALVARRLGRRALPVVLGVLSAVTVVSFAVSWRITEVDPSAAYFVTQARAWEFGAGAVLGLVADTATARRALVRVPAVALSLLSWAGAAALVWCGFVYSGATAFPGSAALVPVIGAMAILVAGAPAGRLSPIPLAALPPVQWIGNISYGVYLWHWPPIIVLPVVLDRDLGLLDRVLILLGTLLMATLSKRYVEDPVRRARTLGLWRRSVTLGLSGAAAAALVAVSLLGLSAAARATEHQQHLADELVSGGVPCAGAASMNPDRPCTNPDLDGLVVPAAGQHDLRETNDGCIPGPTKAKLVTCDIGAVDDPTVPHLFLIGDSHAHAMLPGLKELAADRRLSVTTVLKSACAWSTQPLVDPDPSRVEGCQDWRDQLTPWIEDHVGRGDVVVTTDYNFYLRGPRQDRARGLAQAWREATSRGARVVAVTGNPRFPTGDPNVCLAKSPDDLAACGVRRGRAFGAFDPMAAAVRLVPRAKLIDLTDRLCTKRVCPAVIGGVNVYFDSHHISPTYWRTLAPYLYRELVAVGALPRP